MTDPSSFDYKSALLSYFQSFITAAKLEKFEKIAKNRTRHVTVVLEDVYQAHNASAVLRSCECFGIQDIYFIENRYEYQISPDVALGSTKWIDIYRYNEPEFDNTTACINDLKQKGYKIYATTPHTDDCMINDLPLDQKVALLFGTELEGLSETALKLADGFVRIPMYGFTESYNISVSAALSLFSISENLRSQHIDFGLSDMELVDLKLNWCRKSVKTPELHEKHFLNDLYVEGKSS
jgi:tRNA (guanosine-2'-O-)-methyltransferase